jgi:hypothetical protein
VLGQAPQRGRELRLDDPLPLRREIAVPEQDLGGIGPLPQGLQAEVRHLQEGGIDGKTILRQPDRGNETLGEAQATVALGHVHERSRDAGNGRRKRAIQRQSGYQLAVRVHEEVRVCRARSRLSRIQHQRARVVRRVQQEEAAAPEARTMRLDDTEGGSGRDRGIEGVAPGGQDRLGGRGCQWMGRRDPMLAGSRVRQRGSQQQYDNDQNAGRGSCAPVRRGPHHRKVSPL